MSKKKKKKFKKKFKRSHKKQMQKSSSQASEKSFVDIQAKEDVDNNISDHTELKEESGENANIEADTDQKDVEKSDNQQYLHIKKDIKKTTLILAILLALLVGIYLINYYSGTLDFLGDWIYKVLNISIG